MEINGNSISTALAQNNTEQTQAREVPQPEPRQATNLAQVAEELPDTVSQFQERVSSVLSSGTFTAAIDTQNSSETSPSAQQARTALQASLEAVQAAASESTPAPEISDVSEAPEAVTPQPVVAETTESQQAPETQARTTDTGQLDLQEKPGGILDIEA